MCCVVCVVRKVAAVRRVLSDACVVFMLRVAWSVLCVLRVLRVLRVLCVLCVVKQAR